MAKVAKQRTMPQAGEHQIGNITEYWCLAPLPIPINTPPVPYYINLQKANQTTLDLGSDDYWGTEFAIRIIFAVMFMFFLITFIPHILTIKMYMDEGIGFFSAIIQSTRTLWIAYIINIGFVICTAVGFVAQIKCRP